MNVPWRRSAAFEQIDAQRERVLGAEAHAVGAPRLLLGGEERVQAQLEVVGADAIGQVDREVLVVAAVGDQRQGVGLGVAVAPSAEMT